MIGNTDTRSVYDGVTRDTLGNEFIVGLQESFKQKLFNPKLDPFACERLVRQRNVWRDLGKVTVFTSGVFDMLHPDHSGFLLHTKSLGVPHVYKQYDNKGDWDKLSRSQQQSFARFALSQDHIRLIVGLRADRTTAITKGFNPDKGNVNKPVYAWETRAFQVAKESYVNPGCKDQLLPTVNAVTMYGEHDFAPDSPHHTHYDLAAHLQPDVWAMFEESQEILAEAPKRPSLASVALRYIADEPDRHYFVDANIGKMHTTGIIESIKGA